MLHLSLIQLLLFLASLLSFLSSMLLILGLNTSRLCAPYHMIYPRCPTIWQEKHLSTQPLGGYSALECYSPIVHRNTHVDNATLRSEEEESSRSLSHPCGTYCTEIDHSPFSPTSPTCRIVVVVPVRFGDHNIPHRPHSSIQHRVSHQAFLVHAENVTARSQCHRALCATVTARHPLTHVYTQLGTWNDGPPPRDRQRGGGAREPIN